MRNGKSKLVKLIVGISLAACMAAQADEERGITLSPGIGWFFYDGDRDLEDSLLYSGGIGYRFDNPFGIELVFLQSEPDSELSSSEVDYDHIRIDGLYHFSGTEKITPYLALGYGEGEFDFGNGIDKNHFFVDAGAGIKYAFTERASARFDVRLFDDIDDLAVTLGINYAFGSEPRVREPDTDGDGVKDSADQCSGTPSGVQVDSSGCPRDGDRDGVADYMDDCPRSPVGARVNSKGCSPDDDSDGVPNAIDKCLNSRPGDKVNDMGCLPDLQEAVRVEMNVQFDTGSANTRPAHRSEVQRLADFMSQYQQSRVTIEGHTDSTGRASYNISLSQRRANAIAKMLIEEFGIASSRVDAIGYGGDRPIATNSTAEGRQRNRRVVGVVEAVKVIDRN